MTKLNIIYASEMGTAMAVAEDVEVTAKNKGCLLYTSDAADDC